MKAKIIHIFLVLFIFINNTDAQNKRDYKWLFGSDIEWDTVHIVKGSQIDFNNNAKLDSTVRYATVAQNNTQISDLDGNLLFYFNGCRVIDSTEQIMENGDSLNYGDTWNKFCGKFDHYPGYQNSIILPEPENKNGYFLIYKRIEYEYEPFVHTYIPELKYSYIDMIGNSGRGELHEKDVVIFKTTNIVNGYLSACKHANGKDWWLIQMERDTNIYFKILLTKDSIAVVDSQSMGPNFTQGSNVGQAKFTPMGASGYCLIQLTRH